MREPIAFAYHRSLTPTVGVLLALALVEILVVHLAAIAYWGWTMAAVLGVFDLTLVVTLASLLRSFRRRPILLDGNRLTLRTGWRLSLALDAADIAGFRDDWSAADIKRRETFNMALLAWPNVMIELARPMPRGRRTVTAVAHCVDDPTAFRSVLLQAVRDAR